MEKKALVFDILWNTCLRYPKCIEECSNPEEKAILNSHTNDIIHLPFSFSFMENGETLKNYLSCCVFY